MPHKNSILLPFLENMDLGNSIAEEDDLLNSARVETSAFSDLYHDKVDLIPGTKGSGKSALFRIFTDFLPNSLLARRKIVIAHGVQKHGNTIFQAFRDRFEVLSEDDFVEFWCIYFVSLTHEQFIKNPKYTGSLTRATSKVRDFRDACVRAKIPSITGKKSLKQILDWALGVLKTVRPSVTYKLPQEAGEIEVDLFGQPIAPKKTEEKENGSSPYSIPQYFGDVKQCLETLLDQCDYSLWLMVDRLDELFLRRSEVENRALRGLLRVIRVFSSERIRIKVFLRDDMLEHIVSSGQGFTALTHVTARQADTLRWSEDQILDIIVKRIFSNIRIAAYFSIDPTKLSKSAEYRVHAFYRVFPQTVHHGTRQSKTLRWIYSRACDGKGVVTPRDVIDLLTRAKQKQQDLLSANPEGVSDYLFEPAAIRYGAEELSKKKRITYLEAEFPHLWPDIRRLIGGKTSYSEASLTKIIGDHSLKIIEDLVSIGVIEKSTAKGTKIYTIPYLYRTGLELSQGTES